MMNSIHLMNWVQFFGIMIGLIVYWYITLTAINALPKGDTVKHNKLKGFYVPESGYKRNHEPAISRPDLVAERNAELKRDKESKGK